MDEATRSKLRALGASVMASQVGTREGDWMTEESHRLLRARLEDNARAQRAAAEGLRDAMGQVQVSIRRLQDPERMARLGRQVRRAFKGAHVVDEREEVWRAVRAERCARLRREAVRRVLVVELMARAGRGGDR